MIISVCKQSANNILVIYFDCKHSITIIYYKKEVKVHDIFINQKNSRSNSIIQLINKY